MIAEAQDEKTEGLLRFSEELAEAQSDLKELEEAISAGEAVGEGLERVLKSLKSAKGWGTFDMVGGGIIATAIKHSKIDEAWNSAHQVQQLLRSFQRELGDVGARAELTVDIGSFSKFADYFFDGLIADWVVQSRIKSSLENTVQAQKGVQDIINRLKQSKIKVQEKTDLIREGRQTLLEGA